MQSFMNTIPGIIVTVGGILAVAVVGIGYVVGLWKKNKDGQDDRLIGILEKTVKELGTKVDVLEKRERELTKEVESLRNENKRYIAILEGRDEQTKEFYRKAFESMQTSSETFTIVKGLADSINNTNSNMERLIALLGKHVDIIDHNITSK